MKQTDTFNFLYDKYICLFFNFVQFIIYYLVIKINICDEKYKNWSIYKKLYQNIYPCLKQIWIYSDFFTIIYIISSVLTNNNFWVSGLKKRYLLMYGNGENELVPTKDSLKHTLHLMSDTWVMVATLKVLGFDPARIMTACYVCESWQLFCEPHL